MSKGDIKWWFDAGNGQKWGWMLPIDIRTHLNEIYGQKSGMGSFAKEIGISPSTVSRWRLGTVPMPKLAALYLHQRWMRWKGTTPQLPLRAIWLPECHSANGVSPPFDARMPQPERDAQALAVHEAGGPLPRDVPGTSAWKQRYITTG